MPQQYIRTLLGSIVLNASLLRVRVLYRVKVMTIAFKQGCLHAPINVGNGGNSSQ